MASSETTKTGPSLAWKLYPMAWCAIGCAAAVYIWASPSLATLRAQIETDPAVAERRVAQSEQEVALLGDQNSKLKSQLDESRSETAALEARVAKLAEDLRKANARPVTPAAPAAVPNAPAGVRVTARPPAPLPVTIPAPAAPSADPPIEIVNTVPARTPEPPAAAAAPSPAAEPTATSGPTTTTVAVAPAPQFIPRPDPNAPPLPDRVTETQRVAAANRAKSPGFTTSTTTATNTPGVSSGTQITTGSVAAPSVPAAPLRAVPTAAPSTTTAAAPDAAALRLSSAPSLDSLRLSWRVLNERHGSILQGLTPRYREVAGGPAGTTYQLIAGPLLSRGEAIQLCAMLQVQAVGCGVDNYDGQRL